MFILVIHFTLLHELAECEGMVGVTIAVVTVCIFKEENFYVGYGNTQDSFYLIKIHEFALQDGDYKLDCIVCRHCET